MFTRVSIVLSESLTVTNTAVFFFAASVKSMLGFSIILLSSLLSKTANFAERVLLIVSYVLNGAVSTESNFLHAQLFGFWNLCLTNNLRSFESLSSSSSRSPRLTISSIAENVLLGLSVSTRYPIIADSRSMVILSQ